MPGLVQRNAHSSNLSFSGSVSASWIWNHRGDVTFDQLQKFWSELSPQARQELLRIDKQTLFEHARKNLYCSRCNGLLLEGFSQIVMYGKSLQQEGSQDEVQDPSVHPWGGLAATKDGILTLLDCFLGAKSLKALQNVFDSARARERERELLYPDACGGGGRGWISQGIANYGRGHGTRESCALHTARLSCDTLVDFWSALGDETQQSLLRIKEDDFIERLMYRFDSKRFCRDCRRNVVREFKKLKELKRMRREARCTNSFCVADTAFQYVVSEDTVQADWHQSFTDVLGSYHHFEWAIGTAEGKSNILEFEDVGLNGSVQVSGLDLAGLSSCFITLRAWKLDGRCIELSVKAHALKGQSCIHRRLIVGDGYVTITKGESIRRFFEHAEEAEEEEDDDSMDKDGNDPDGDGSRPQKHAKSPELAQEFLLDAATVIFKDQVEKAFREGTARQNAHSIFICLALKLLEERVHVACKEIITLQKQIKLLEEEEKEKRIEEERKERRKMKEREKKLRRKERLKGKDKECMEPKQLCCALDISGKESSLNAHEESRDTSNSGDSISETGENMLCSPLSSDTVDEKLSSGFEEEILGADSLEHYQYDVEWNFSAMDGHSSFKMERSKSSRRKLRFRNDLGDFQGSRWRDRRSPFMVDKGDFQVDKAEASSNGYVAISSRRANGMHRQSRKSPVKFDTRNCGAKFGENFHCSTNRVHDSYDLHSCSSNQHNNNYRSTDASVGRSGRVYKSGSKMNSVLDVSIRPVYRSIKCNHDCYGPDTGGGHKSNISSGRIPQRRGEILHNNKVWGVRESEKSFCRSSLKFDATFRPSDVGDIGAEQSHENRQSIDKKYSSDLSQNLDETDALNYQNEEVGEKKSCSYSSSELQNDCHKGFDLAKNSNYYLKNLDSQEAGSFPITSDPVGSSFSSSSDNCSSCLSEGDSSTGSSGAQNTEFLCTSDSEDAGRQSEAKVMFTCTKSPSETCLDVSANERDKTEGQESCTSGTSSCTKSTGVEDKPIKNQPKPDTVRVEVGNDSRQHDVTPMHSQCVQFPVFPVPSSMGYYHQTPTSWATGPPNGLVQFPQQNCFLLAGPLTYGLSANQSSQFGLLYGATPQTLTAPVLKVSHLPWYQLPNKDTQLNSKEQTKSSELSDTREPTDVAAAVVSERHLDKPLRNGLLPQKASSPRKDGNHAKPHDGTSNFSLFHFGGPISASLKDESIGDFSSKQAGLEVHLACSKKETTIEEYSLFAATNTSRFSFF